MSSTVKSRLAGLGDAIRGQFASTRRMMAFAEYVELVMAQPARQLRSAAQYLVACFDHFGTEQVRYWSICSNEYRKPYPVSSCLADEAIPLDDQGRYTIVVATPEDRPAHADAAHDAAWLRWGSTDHDVLLLVRNMLADPDFAESATRLAPGALAVSSMGAYAPTGAICTPAQFDAGDAACG